MPAFMAVEPLLEARIKAQLAMPNIHVLTAQDLSKVGERAQHTPAVHVIYGGLSVVVDKGLVGLAERWLTIVAVRHSGDNVGGQKARESAGPILNAVWLALHGWIPSADYKALIPTTPPDPGFSAGFGYYPLAWDCPFKKIPNPCPSST